jgi:hypothetical protein
MPRRRPTPGPESSIALRAALEAARASGAPVEDIAERLAAAVETECKARLESGPYRALLREARRRLAVRA